MMIPTIEQLIEACKGKKVCFGKFNDTVNDKACPITWLHRTVNVNWPESGGEYFFDQIVCTGFWMEYDNLHGKRVVFNLRDYDPVRFEIGQRLAREFFAWERENGEGTENMPTVFQHNGATN